MACGWSKGPKPTSKIQRADGVKYRKRKKRGTIDAKNGAVRLKKGEGKRKIKEEKVIGRRVRDRGEGKRTSWSFARVAEIT